MLESGIINLDRILGGGIPEGDVLLVMGGPGSGKTTLSFQIGFHAARAGKRVAYVSTMSEPPTRLITHLRSFSFFDETQIGKNLVLLNIYPNVKRGVDTTIDALIGAVTEHRSSLLLIDGLDTIRDLHGDRIEIRTFIYELAVALSALGCTTIMTSTGSSALLGNPSPELTMSDGIVILGLVVVGTQVVRTIQVQKMRGLSPLLGIHTLTIGSDGAAVFPRVESLVQASEVTFKPERIPIGLPELDGMLSGGLTTGSVTLLAGAPGTGKTILGLQYVLEGARRGERAMFVGFRESPSELIEKMHTLGKDLATPVKAGLISIVHRLPIDLQIDQVLDETQRQIDEFAPKRLMMDSIAELEYAVPGEWRRRTVMACLAELVRGRGVTAIFARELGQVIGPELDFSDSPLAVLGENLIFLRDVEFRSELYRVLAILKARDTAYDRSIRQYEIGAGGLRVVSIMESAEGILTGIARLPSEMRVKRSVRRASEEG